MTETICPLELLLPVPPKPVPEDGAVLTGNEAGLRFVGALGGHSDDLADRIADALAECPK